MWVKKKLVSNHKAPSSRARTDQTWVGGCVPSFSGASWGFSSWSMSCLQWCGAVFISGVLSLRGHLEAISLIPASICSPVLVHLTSFAASGCRCPYRPKRLVPYVGGNLRAFEENLRFFSPMILFQKEGLNEHHPTNRWRLGYTTGSNKPPIFRKSHLSEAVLITDALLLSADRLSSCARANTPNWLFVFPTQAASLPLSIIIVGVGPAEFDGELFHFGITSLIFHVQMNKHRVPLFMDGTDVQSAIARASISWETGLEWM